MLKHPRHIDDFLLYRIHNLARLATHGVGLMFRREIGISRRDWRILAFVGRYPELSLKRLSELAALDTVVASRCVALLVRRGMIANVRLPSNKRITVLTLTEAGRGLYERAWLAGRGYNVEFVACLSDSEADILDTLLTRLEARAGEMTRREIETGGAAGGDDAD
ncbi:MarR family winged helix-turn-helix transcriptional regulator [Bordetella sp. FB-8]|uniref:MarR family winged helix-turn-helix transcriptional regulator n=1 Tax=Bordetella sp. FB-8 TaxID=1159870 RepID=UPI000381510C|nr:MarR family transcriptional regulator [Bordetella sp. FB-8]